MEGRTVGPGMGFIVGTTLGSWGVGVGRGETGEYIGRGVVLLRLRE